MISELNEGCLQLNENFVQVDSETGKSPAHHVLTDTLRELYWSKHQLMRTLLKLENAALNVQLRRTIHDYFDTTRIQVYTVEHIFELLDEGAEGRRCELTEMICRNAVAMLNRDDKMEGKDKNIRSHVAEFFAQELTTLQYLLKLCLSIGRSDIARIVNEMHQTTRAAFELGFVVTQPTNTVAA